ncbi:hypothetical protein HMPREF1092_00362 [Clostridium thermobutyricum]|uniref:Uncharacterized protein n=1 Tax=Clostridium thermobutyricum TaxID=29372 RepID=N9WJA4_9CLOT|nr:hypothetical protein [Clostridium thermobutyricum]ENZ03176.1 hypothetical protein HMPREF1092_00362 [Clostridium thermobutyricum]
MYKKIEGFYQDALIKNGLDIKDVHILRYMLDFMDSGILRKRIIDGKDFYWIRTDLIIEDNPILKINLKNSIRKRIKKLIDKEFLEYVNCKKGTNKTLYRRGNALEKIEDKDYKIDLSNFKEEYLLYKEEDY